MLGDLVDEPCELAGLALDLGGGLGEGRGRNAAAVAADVALELLLALQRRRVGLAMRDHALDERADALQSGVRLLGSEVAHGHNPMIRVR